MLMIQVHDYMAIILINISIKEIMETGQRQQTSNTWIALHTPTAIKMLSKTFENDIYMI
jgi:hypothetical protein